MKLLISALFSTVAALAAEHMSVAVCNVGELPAQVIERAEAEAAYVFQSMDVEVRWTVCGAEVDAADPDMRPDFIMRVRMGGNLPKAGDTSLDAMGRAFMNLDGTGKMADVYYGAIRQLALLYPVAGADQLMGYTMAHDSSRGSDSGGKVRCHRLPGADSASAAAKHSVLYA